MSPSLNGIDVAPLSPADLLPAGRGRARNRAASPSQGRPGAAGRRRRSRGPHRLPSCDKDSFSRSVASPAPSLPSSQSPADFSQVPNVYPCNWNSYGINWAEEVENNICDTLPNGGFSSSISANPPPTRSSGCDTPINAHHDVRSVSLEICDSSTIRPPCVNTDSLELSPNALTRQAPLRNVLGSSDDALESFFNDDDAFDGVKMLFDTAADPLPSPPPAASPPPSVSSTHSGRRKSKKERKRLGHRLRRGRHHISHWYARAVLPDAPPDPFQHGLLVLPYSMQAGSQLHNDMLRRRDSPVPQRRNSAHPLLGRRFPSPPRDVPHYSPLVSGRTLLPLLHHSWRRNSPPLVNARGIHFLVDSGTPDSVIPWWLHNTLVQRHADIPLDNAGYSIVTFTTGQADIQLRVKIAAPDDNCMPTIGFHDIQRLNLRIEPSSRRVKFTTTSGSRTSAIADFEQLPEPTPQPSGHQDF